MTRYRLLHHWLALLSQMMPNYASQALVRQRHLPAADPEMPRFQRVLAAGNRGLGQHGQHSD